MKERKNIDRLFQEKFKDFEQIPEPVVWENIERALLQKEKRRVIPIWWKFAGAAAILLPLIFGLQFLFSDQPSANETFQNGNIQNGTVTAEPKQSENKEDSDNSAETKLPTTTSNAVANTNEESKETVVNPNSESTANQNDAERQQSTAIRKPASANAKRNLPQTASRNAVATSSKDKAKFKGKNARQNANALTNAASAVALQNNQTANAGNGNKNSSNETIVPELKPLEKDPIVYALPEQNSANSNKSTTNSAQVAEQSDTKDIENQAIAVAEPNPLEQLLQQQNDKTETKVADAKREKWQITPNVAPVYFNSASNGSPIHSAFASNDKTYDRSMSVGINVNYAINKRFAVRTGVNRLQLGYETNEVAFIAALDGQIFETTTVTPAARGVTVVNRSQMDAGALNVDTAMQQASVGSMNQDFGYFEVPLEMSYKLLDQQFGINVIGGLSTLFLSESNVSLQSETFSTSLGEATNLNNVHFSSNIGVGFQYKFFKNFELNFEPMFKYQINTFSRDEGNFRPYFIALYSGISYRF
jgi:hypothetical protein